MPEISIIIPSYNHAAYIQDAVNSVLNQTWKDLELIVIDDGSKDDTLQILERIKDARMSVHSQSNQGAHTAINRGLEMATGQYLAVLNSDDLYHPRRLEKVINAFKANSRLGLVGSYIEIVDGNGNRIGMKEGYHNCEPWLLEVPEKSFRAGNDLTETLLTENFFSTTSNFAFTRQAFDETGKFLALRYLHDWDFALRLLNHFEIELLPEFLVRYRVHSSNTIREDHAAMIFEICWILARHLPRRRPPVDFAEKEAEGGIRPDASLPGQNIDRLLHSIFTYNNDRVLNVLLLQDLDVNQAAALELLHPDSRDRKTYIEFITSNLRRAEEQTSAATGAEIIHQPQPESFYRKVRRHLRPLKAAYIRLMRKMTEGN